MYWAVHEGNFEFVEVVIRTLFDFNTLRFRGVNVLHQAAKNGDIEIIKLILKFAEEKKINALSVDSPVSQTGAGNGHIW